MCAQATYNNNLMPKFTPFTCFSFSINLKQVCDPNTGFWDPVGGCTCVYGPGTCGTKDLSNAATLYIFYSVRALNYVVTPVSCGGFANGSPTTQFTNVSCSVRSAAPAAAKQPPAEREAQTTRRKRKHRTRAQATSSLVYAMPSCGPRPPSPPPPPSPSPPPGVVAPSPPPSPPAPFTGYATFIITSFSRSYAASDCATLAGPVLVYFYNGRYSYAGQSCSQSATSTGSSTYYSITLTLWYQGQFANSDVNYMYLSMLSEANWRSIISNMKPGCGFVASYSDSLSNAYFVATAASATTPAPRYVLGDLACPPGTSPSPPPPSPAPSPPPAPPSPPPPPSPAPACVMYVFFQLTPGYALDVAACNRFANQVAFLFSQGLPTTVPWQCGAYDGGTLTALAAFPSSTVRPCCGLLGGNQSFAG